MKTVWVLLVLVALSSIVMFPPPANAACPDQAAITAYIADFEAARVSKGFGTDLTLADAECAMNKLIKELPRVLGRLVGYKAAFTNPALQQALGLTGPAWGAMFVKMMVNSGARLPAKFGAFPLYEADLIAVVKDAGLADAKTQLEALQHISDMMPFIELPDRMVGGQITGASAIAINILFRGGALGSRMKVESIDLPFASLANMTVVMTEDKSGRELGRAKGTVLMDHPINAAMWLAQALKKEGIALRPGDLLSLGTYLPAAPVQAGTSITVKYVGLPGAPSVTVHFE